MRSDFINKRDFQRRRNATSTQNFVDGEIIVIPEFDTFYWHNPTQAADDRWIGEIGEIGGNYETASEVPVGLLNPWNDGADIPSDSSGGVGTSNIQNRTPTRAAMAFNLSTLPANAQIIDAKLNLTVANKRDWD